MQVPSDEDIAWALKHGATVRIRVDGRSMEPALRRGWWVKVEPVRARLSLGDIILFQAAGSLVVHRVVAELDTAHGGIVFQMGETARTPTPIRSAQVLGVVVAVDEPTGITFPTLDVQPPTIRRHFENARRAAALFGEVKRLGEPVLKHTPSGLRRRGRQLYWWLMEKL